MSHRSRLILSSLLLGMAFTSCVMIDEGCLDPLASNFEVAADRDCCCEYPALTVSVLHRIDDQSLELGAFDEDAGLDIGGFTISLSEIELQREDGTWFTVTESETIRLSSDITAGSIEIPTNNLITSTLSARTVLGSMQNGSDITAVRMRVGLPSDWTDLSLSSIDQEGHHLAALADLYSEQDRQYTEMEIRYRRDTLEPYEALSWSIAEGREEQITLDLAVEVIRGEGLTLGLILDYQRLLAGVIPGDDIDSQRAQVLSNIPTSWSAMRF